MGMKKEYHGRCTLFNSSKKNVLIVRLGVNDRVNKESLGNIGAWLRDRWPSKRADTSRVEVSANSASKIVRFLAIPADQRRYARRLFAIDESSRLRKEKDLVEVSSEEAEGSEDTMSAGQVPASGQTRKEMLAGLKRKCMSTIGSSPLSGVKGGLSPVAMASEKPPMPFGQGHKNTKSDNASPTVDNYCFSYPATLAVWPLADKLLLPEHCFAGCLVWSGACYEDGVLF